MILRCVELGLTLAIFLLISITCKGQDGFIEGEPTLAYWKIGSKKEIVIVLHGGPNATHRYLRPEFDGLSKAAQVIYYDQRGKGKSQQATIYHWKAHVEDLNRLINKFTKTGKVFLAGSSWGTTLAMLYTYKYPARVKGLILSGTYNWQGRGYDSIRYEAYKKSQYQLSPPIEAGKAFKLKLKEHRLISMTTDKGRKDTIVTIEKEMEVYSGDTETQVSVVTAPVIDSLRQITQPVLLFNGDYPVCRIDEAHTYVKLFPHAELYTIPGACHDPWISDPEKFSAKCVQFIKKFHKVSKQ